jgi:hypothetical protein
LSASEALSEIALAVLIVVATLRALLTGAAFTSPLLTVIVTVAMFESSRPSLALKVKLSGPV